MAEETIKEFLVSLGWNGQDSDHEKFAKALEAATLRAELLAKGIEALVKNLLGGANRTSEAYDRLYYAAERMHTTVAQIQALQYAMGQVGGSAEEALATMETAAALFQQSKGNLPYLQHFGFDIDKKTGELKWTLETLKAHGLLNESDAQTSLWAERLGISQATAMRFKQHPYDIDKFSKEKEEADKSIGFNPDEGAKKAEEFEQAMGRFIMLVKGFYDKFALKADDNLTKPLEAFNDFLVANGPVISEILSTFAKAVGGVGDSISGLVTTWLENPKSKKDIQEFFEHLLNGVNWLISAIHIGGLIYRGLASPFNGELVEKFKEGWAKTHFRKVEPGQPGYDGSFHVTMDGRPVADEGSLKKWLTEAGRWIAEKIGGVVIDDGVIKTDGMKVGTGNPLPVKIDELSEDGIEGGGGNYITRAFNYMKARLLGGDGGGGGGVGMSGYHEGPYPAHNLGAGLPTKGGNEGGVDLSHVSPDLVTQFKKLYDSLTPEEQAQTWITSGYRNNELQAVLYNRYLHGGPLAAPPGHSNHNKGLALDVHDGSGAVHRKAGQFDLHFPLGRKDWPHMQLNRPPRDIEPAKKPVPGSDKTSRLHGATSKTFAMRESKALASRLPQPRIYNQEVVVHIDGSQDPATVGHIVGRHVTQMAGDLTKQYNRAIG